MTANDIIAVLQHRNQWYERDSLNPDYTIHLENGDVFDTVDADGDWYFITVAREFYRIVAIVDNKFIFAGG